MGQTFRKLFDSIFGNKEMRVRSCVLSFFPSPCLLLSSVLFRHPSIAVSIFCLFLSSWRKKGGKRVERKCIWLFSLHGKLGKIVLSRGNASVILRDCASSGIPVGKSCRLSGVYSTQICIQKYFLHALIWNSNDKFAWNSAASTLSRGLYGRLKGKWLCTILVKIGSVVLTLLFGSASGDVL